MASTGTEPKIVDFGWWVKQKIDASDNPDVSVAAVSKEARIDYSTLHDMLKAADRGMPRNPRDNTVKAIGNALVELKVIESIDEAWANAHKRPRPTQSQVQRQEITRIQLDSEGEPLADDEREIVAFYRGAPDVLKSAMRRIVQPDSYDEFDEGEGESPPPGSHD
jgi:hypothetical protein